MKLKLFAAALAAVGVWSAHAAVSGKTITLAENETFTITDFNNLTKDGTTVSTNGVVILNDGSTLKVAADALNVDAGVVFHIQLQGGTEAKATFDLTNLPADKILRFRKHVYSVDGAKLKVTGYASKHLALGGAIVVSDYSDSPDIAAVSADCLEVDAGTTLDLYGAFGCWKWPLAENITAYQNYDQAGEKPAMMGFGTNMFASVTVDNELTFDQFSYMMVNDKAIPSTTKINVRNNFTLKGSQWYEIRTVGVVTRTATSVTFYNPIDVASGSRLYSRGGTAYYKGPISGGGQIYAFGWGQTMYFRDAAFTFTGSVYGGQRGTIMSLGGTSDHVTLGSMTLNVDTFSGGKYAGSGGYSQLFEYVPSGTGDNDTSISFTSHNVGGCTNSNADCTSFIGSRLNVYPRQTLTMSTLTGYGVALTDGKLEGATKPGTFCVGNWNTTESAYSQAWVSTNINIVATNATKKYEWYYCRKGPNRATFKIVNSAESSAASIIRGESPSPLPYRIEGFRGTLRIGEGVASPNWNFVIDTTAEVYCDTACAGSGTLSVPASGAMTVSFKEGVPVTYGRFPLVTGTAGGAAFANGNWTLNGETLEVGVFDWTEKLGVTNGAKVWLNVDATGVWLNIPRGLILMLK